MPQLCPNCVPSVSLDYRCLCDHSSVASFISLWDHDSFHFFLIGIMDTLESSSGKFNVVNKRWDDPRSMFVVTCV